MKFWPRRRPPVAPAPPRANATRIAVIEHDLLGIPPEPGSAAALVIAMRRTGTCIEHEPVETTGFHEARRHGLCTRCGAAMVLEEDEWRVATP
ncbi:MULTISPECIES: hypothetical protein [Streptomyces]|uniref:hypothetical protein n=1 Tax=Streptomyces TaxID=1883 RepID=UPI001679732E|nr:MULTISPECIES: hypothetical protein [Streptomyces]MBK3524830.1 hypothetical protein [Streptomyces sp. MBT70]GGR71069.1 hypothetical protein GCM10010236_26690 [Streptomyces eurythermus]